MMRNAMKVLQRDPDIINTAGDAEMDAGLRAQGGRRPGPPGGPPAGVRPGANPSMSQGGGQPPMGGMGRGGPMPG